MPPALRSLAQSRAFSLTVILTIALGLGANTAIFTVVHAVLLAPLPYRAADELVVVSSRNLQQGAYRVGLAPAGYRELERQATSFATMAASRYNYANLTRVERPTLLTDAVVTQDFFAVLGVKPHLGRTFTAADAAAGAPPSVVLGYGLWQTHFGGRVSLVGDTIMLDDVPHTVIGVMPATFKEPSDIASCWRVLPSTGGENLAANSRYWNVIARLKPDVAHSAVEAELATIAARLAQSDAKFYRGWDLVLHPLKAVVVGPYRDGLLLVVGAAVLVLLITCANVAGLQLVRASARQHDTAIRIALGGSRWAIVRAQLAQTLVLVGIGCAGGVLLAKWGLDLLLASLAGGWIPRAGDIAINTPVLLATGSAALLTALVCGLYPALRTTRVDAADSLRDGSRGSTGPRSLRVRSTLVVGQVALTLVLLVCAGLVLKSFATIVRVNPGMQVDQALSLGLSLLPRYDNEQKRADYFRQITERVSSVPGVEAAAFTQTMPFTWGINVELAVKGREDEAEKLPPALFDSVSHSFFSTMRIPLRSGRTFGSVDRLGAPRVAVISQATAKKYFPDGDAIGQHLLLPTGGATPPESYEVIGIVGDVPRFGLDAEVPLQVYASMEQRPWFFATLLVRSALPLEALTQTVQREIWALNPDQPIANIAPVRQLVRATLTQPQLYLTLFSLFAALALLLAAIGLYGLIAYNVSQRTREFGIRFALGAQAADVIRLVLRQGVRLTALGLGLGLAGAVVAAQLMQTLLFRTAAYDPLVFAAGVVVLGLIAIFAGVLPARRALKVNPITALRSE